MDLYADNILDHSKHPRHAGVLEHATVIHAEKNLSCGDTISLQLLIEDNIIKDIAWTGAGCAISQSGMSILSEALIGKSIQELDALTPNDIHALLGVPISTRRLKCSLLGLHTLKNTLHAWKGEELQSWQETVGNEEKTR